MTSPINVNEVVADTPPVPVAGQRRAGGAFSSPGFRWFFVGQVFLALGIWVGDVGMRWLVQAQTGSPFYVGLIGFSATVPVLAFSLLGGVLADRVDRVRLIVLCRGIGVLIILLLAALASVGQVAVWQVVLLAFVWGTTGSLEIPARQALFPNLVRREDLMHAVALYSGIWSATMILGPAVAGWVIAGVGIAGCFYLTAALHTLTVVVFLRVKRYVPPRVEGETKEHPWEAFVGGLRYTRAHTVIFALLVMAVLQAFFGQTVIMALLPSFAVDVLHGGVSAYSLLLTSAGIGALGANIALAARAGLTGKGRWTLVSGLVFGLSLMALSVTDVLPLSLGVIALVGAVNAVFMTLVATLIQTHVTEEMRGRVMSAYILTWGMTSFGSLLMGALGSTIGVPQAIAIGGFLTLVAVVAVIARVPELLRL